MRNREPLKTQTMESIESFSESFYVFMWEHVNCIREEEKVEIDEITILSNAKGIFM